MSNEEDATEKKPGNNAEGVINAVTGLARAIPIYDDAIQPAAKEVGKSLETVAKTVNLALAPVKGLVWGYEQLEEFVSIKVSNKLRNTPQEEIVSPKPNVAGPALEALRYIGHEESLRELYANLLASSMDAATTANAHPSFVEVLKQITPDEARLLKVFSSNRPLPLIDVTKMSKDRKMGGVTILTNFSLYGEEANCEHSYLTPMYIDNLCRLGLIEIPPLFEYTAPNIYDSLENHPIIQGLKKQIENNTGDDSGIARIEKKGIRITQLGKLFITACVNDHALTRPEVKKDLSK